MALRIVTVDAFTDTPFSGNPAAVCVLPEPRDDRWMHLVAREMNLSETAFLREEDGGYHLRPPGRRRQADSRAPRPGWNRPLGQTRRPPRRGAASSIDHALAVALCACASDEPRSPEESRDPFGSASSDLWQAACRSSMFQRNHSKRPEATVLEIMAWTAHDGASTRLPARKLGHGLACESGVLVSSAAVRMQTARSTPTSEGMDSREQEGRSVHSRTETKYTPS